MKILPRHELQPLLEEGLFRRLSHESYTVHTINPRKLLTPNRLDLCLRLLYLELRHLVPALADYIYSEDIRAHSLGTYNDDINPSKNSLETFKSVFHNLYSDISKNGFDSSTTLIPLANDGSILNGAHRTASAIFSNREVSVVSTELPRLNCDYNFFYQRAVPSFVLEQAALKYVDCAENIFVALLWPSAYIYNRQVESLFKSVIYKKTLALGGRGALNLLYQCYHHMNWIGTDNNSFRGLYQKLNECFPTTQDPVTYFLFQSEGDLAEVRALKQKIRDLCNVGLSSIHITDTKEEALALSRLILNDNGVHYLNNAPLIKPQTRQKLDTLILNAQDVAIASQSFMIDGSFTLELYGLRNAADLDIVSSNSESELHSKLHLDTRKQDIQYHDKTANELIYDPTFYFYLHGLKIVGLKQLLHMKRNRAHPKDNLDVELINSMISHDTLRQYIRRSIQYALYLKHRLYASSVSLAVKLLKNLRIYHHAKRLLRG